MPRNGSGQYDLVVNSWNPAVNGVPATPADWQSLINDVAAAISQSLSRDGQTVAIGNLPMGGNKLTGLGVGTASGDSLAWQQLFSQGTQVDLASAATTDIGLVNSTNVNITGTTTITSFGLNYNGPRYLRFNAALTLTHSANLVLPGLGNILTASGDSAIVVPLGAPVSGWRVVSYQRAADAPGIPDNSISTAKIQNDAVTFAKLQNIATATLVGRTAAGSGDAVDLTPAQFAPIITDRIEPINATVAASAMTITLNPTTLDFRSATLGSGTVNTRTIATAISLVIPSGATLGATNAQPARFNVYAIDNAGTVELAVSNANISGNLDESGVISSTAISAASDSNNVIYSTTARTNVPYRIVGYIDNTQVTAGTYATAPTLVQGAGGQSLQHVGQVVLAAAATASGTSIDFTGIPVWAKKVRILLSGISLNGTSHFNIQIGQGALTITGYSTSSSSVSTTVSNSTAGVSSTTGFVIYNSAAVGAFSGFYEIHNILGVGWVGMGIIAGNGNSVNHAAGSSTVNSAIDRVRITTLNGTDTYDAGSISISYE